LCQKNSLGGKEQREKKRTQRHWIISLTRAGRKGPQKKRLAQREGEEANTVPGKEKGGPWAGGKGKLLVSALHRKPAGYGRKDQGKRWDGVRKRGGKDAGGDVEVREGRITLEVRVAIMPLRRPQGKDTRQGKRPLGQGVVSLGNTV